MNLQDAVAEVAAVLPQPLPDGFFVNPNPETNSILVGNNTLAFAITEHTIVDRLHVRAAKESWPALLTAIVHAYAIEAAKLDPKALISFVDSLKLSYAPDLNEFLNRGIPLADAVQAQQRWVYMTNDERKQMGFEPKKLN